MNTHHRYSKKNTEWNPPHASNLIEEQLTNYEKQLITAISHNNAKQKNTTVAVHIVLRSAFHGQHM